MKKILSVILVSLLFVGCSNPNTTTPGQLSISSKALSLTPGLEDCSLYEFKKDLNDNRTIKIVRCPSTSTTSVTETVPNGKTTIDRTTVLIDGVEYVRQ